MNACVAALVWIAAIYRLYVLWRNPCFINSAYLAAVALAAAAFTEKVVEAPIDSMTGRYVGDLLEHLLVVAMGVSIQLYLLAVEVDHPSRRRSVKQVAVAAAVAAGMIVAFLAAPIHNGPAGIELDQAYSDVAWVQIYRLIFNTYLAYVLIDIIRLSRRYAGATGDEGRSTNLRLIGWGSAIGLIYSGSRLLSILAATATGRPLLTVEAIGSTAALVAIAFVAAGVSSPRLVPWLKDRRAARRGIKRLNLLWRDLTRTYPGVVLSGGPFLIAVRRADFIFDRRLLETGESLLLVRLPESAAHAVVDAQNRLPALAAALIRSRSHWVSATGPPAGSLLPPARNRDDEVDTLLALADAYAAVLTNSPSGQPVRA